MVMIGVVPAGTRAEAAIGISGTPPSGLPSNGPGAAQRALGIVALNSSSVTPVPRSRSTSNEPSAGRSRSGLTPAAGLTDP